MKKRFSFSVMLFSLAFTTFVSCKKNDDNPQQPSLQVPKMEVTAPKGDFVNGTTSKTITISNTGGTDVTITSVELTGANADEFTTTASPTTIAVGKKYEFTVTLSPKTNGEKTANVVIKSNAGTITIPLKGTATITPKVTFVTNKAEGDSFMLSVAIAENDIPEVWFDRNNNGVKDEGEALLEVLYPSVKAGNLFVEIGSSNTVSIYGKFTKMEFLPEKGIISFDISQNEYIKTFSCGGSDFKGVTLNTSLTNMYCNNSKLTSLDISKLTELKGLYLNENNSLTSLDLSKNTKLTYVQLNGANSLQCVKVSVEQLTNLVANWFKQGTRAEFKTECN
ncbi:choice-of-anchor D domain-containing protein [Capnocytophaga sputigena]|uniref:choice-of-anchor D domain-containing protein n=1 Tax=Capnocytophaga sputigena TaxID=1019 RepID=UPI0028D6C0A3|nr:choice-of-anchor D domain-containing protein [Capnocytophaga sputigena]